MNIECDFQLEINADSTLAVFFQTLALYEVPRSILDNLLPPLNNSKSLTTVPRETQPPRPTYIDENDANFAIDPSE